MSTEPLIEVRTTFGSRADAESCARQLVESRLAACVQVDGPLMSIYRWEEAVETAEEWRCTCKTTCERETDCVAAISMRHAYATPQLTVVRITASAAYAAWVRECVAPA